MKLYYHEKWKNFGDCVNYNIFKELFNQDITRTRYYKADFLGIGSVLTRVLYNPTPHHTWKNLRKLYYSVYEIKPEITDLRYMPRFEITPEYVLDRYQVEAQTVEDIKSALTAAFNELFKNNE